MPSAERLQRDYNSMKNDNTHLGQILSFSMNINKIPLSGATTSRDLCLTNYHNYCSKIVDYFFHFSDDAIRNNDS